MIDESKLSEVLELAKKTGRLLVSQDIADAIQAKQIVGESTRLDGIKLEVSRLLPAGTVMACDFPRLGILEAMEW